jgi:hypothetical protein
MKAQKPNQQVNFNSISREDLFFMRDVILTYHPYVKKSDYKIISDIIKVEFNLIVSDKDLWILDEPTIEEDLEDLTQMYLNLGFDLPNDAYENI